MVGVGRVTDSMVRSIVMFLTSTGFGVVHVVYPGICNDVLPADR